MYKYIYMCVYTVYTVYIYIYLYVCIYVEDPGSLNNHVQWLFGETPIFLM